MKDRTFPLGRRVIDTLVSTMQKVPKQTGSSTSHSQPSTPKKGKLSEADELRTALRDKEELHARTLAEFDNYRKRVAKEGDALARAGVRDLLLELLLVQDSFDRAFQSEALKGDGQAYQGVRSIQRQVHQLLSKQGVMSFDSTGQAFNPSLHEAVDTEPSHKLLEGTILRELEKGYICNDPLIN